MNDYQKQGWVRLHRKICDNKLWFAEKFTKGQAWIDLFLNANHTDGSFWVRGVEVKLKRGQIGWSELTMVARWGWSKNKVRRYLKWLETEQQIVQQKSFQTTIITILKYDEHQTDRKTIQQTEQQKDSRQNSRRNTNKNVKNDKNEKKLTSKDKSLPSVNKIIELFEPLNPITYRKWYANKTQRAAVERLSHLLGDKLELAIKAAAEANTKPYAPTITTPLQLEDKLSALRAFVAKENGKSKWHII